MRVNFERMSKELKNVTEEFRGRLNFLNEAVGVEMFLKISKSIRNEANEVEEKLNTKIEKETENKNQIMERINKELQEALQRITNIENNTYTLVENQNNNNGEQSDQYRLYSQTEITNNLYNNPMLSDPYMLQ